MGAVYDDKRKGFFVHERYAPMIEEHILSDSENIVFISDVAGSKMVLTSEKEFRSHNRDRIAYSVEDLGIPDKNGVYVYDDFEKIFKKSRERIYCLSTSLKRRQISISLFKWFERYSFYPCEFENITSNYFLKKDPSGFEEKEYFSLN